MKKKISLNLEHKQCHTCKHWEYANELGSFCSNKLVKVKNISGNCKRYKPESLTFIRFYRTTNGVFVSLLLDSDKYSIEIALKKGYNTEIGAKKALEKIAKRMGYLK